MRDPRSFRWIATLIKTGTLGTLTLSVCLVSPALAAPKKKNSGRKGSISQRSQEWQSLPPQSWEMATTQLPPEVDRDGIDSRSRIHFHQESGIHLPFWVAPEDFEPIGEITGSRSIAEYLTLGDVILFEYDSDKEKKISIGDIVSIASPSVSVSGKSSSRDGEVFPLLGSARVVGSEGDDHYIAEIVSAREPILRGSRILPLVPRAKLPALRPAPQALQAYAKIPPQALGTRLSQTQIILIDRGTEDGIAEGMIFRAYQTEDPNTKKTLTSTARLIAADILVIAVSQNYATGLVQKGRTELPDDAPLVALTDISDAAWKKEYSTPGATPPAEDQALDALDRGSPAESPTPPPAPAQVPAEETDPTLSQEEKRELEQLETYQAQDPAQAPTPESAAPNVKSGSEVDGELDAEPTPPAPAAPEAPAVPAETPTPSEATDPELDG